MRSWLVASCFLLAFIGCIGEPALENASILPLEVGSSWTYVRTRYVRGDVAEIDTFRVSVMEGNRLIRRANTGTDTIPLIQVSDERFDRVDSGRFVDLDPRTSVAMFFPVLSPIHTRYTERTERITDTTVIADGHLQRAKRLHQHIELLDDFGSVALKLDFNHAFLPGLGPHHAVFVADLSQCQACSLISEFYTFSLVTQQ